jgi:hypothetical protein
MARTASVGLLHPRQSHTPTPWGCSDEIFFSSATGRRQAADGVDTLRFDAESLRIFYLYDVLLHEIEHHIDGGRSQGEVERFAHWFSDYQRSRLLH